tara:strand:+ start:3472 stop:3687 length:216 start_codon:yes stop_codon:yes gene_type:complete
MSEQQITKEQWLEGRIMVDEYGRKPGLADLPLTMMSRQESFDKQKFDQDHINELWESWKGGDYYVSDGITL